MTQTITNNGTIMEVDINADRTYERYD